ncbi:MAG: hypothetical protein D6737_06410, partial [Chloroflexi bacterium]
MLELNHSIYDLTQNLQGAIFRGAYTTLGDDAPPFLSQKYPLMQVRAGYAESCAWLMVQVAEFDPEPLTIERFRVRAVYSSENIARAMLELLMSEGWLNRIDDEYTFTDAGRAVMQEAVEWRISVLKDFVPIDTSEIERLDALQSRVLDASMQAGDPPGTWCLAHSRNRVIEDAPVMYRLLHHATDFNAFRDDSHMATYREHDIDGHTWEALAFVAD